MSHETKQAPRTSDWIQVASRLNGYPQLNRIVRGVDQILLRAKIPFGRLYGSVAEQQLDLLKLAAARAA
jgi:hypothetical protein